MVLFVLFPLQLWADAWTVDKIPMVHLEDARRYVCNPDGVLSKAYTDSIDVVLGRLESKKGIQTAAVVVKAIEGGDCYEFAMALGRKYGIGSKDKSTGLILVLSTEDRCYQILTGNGLEGSLPDAICRRVQNQYMVPYLKEGDWNQAMLQTVIAIERYLDGDETLTADDESFEDYWMFVGIVVFGIIAFSMFVMMVTSRCPKCGKFKMKKVSTKKIKGGKYLIVYKCSHCGNTITKIEQDSDHYHGGSIGGGGFGSSGGSSFGGGSFGGGSFGGGGSGGRF